MRTTAPSAGASQRISRFPSEVFAYVPSSQTPPPPGRLALAAPQVLPSPSAEWVGGIELHFRGSIARPARPLSTLRPGRCRPTRMTRGRVPIARRWPVQLFHLLFLRGFDRRNRLQAIVMIEHPGAVSPSAQQGRAFLALFGPSRPASERTISAGRGMVSSATQPQMVMGASQASIGVEPAAWRDRGGVVSAGGALEAAELQSGGHLPGTGSSPIGRGAGSRRVSERLPRERGPRDCAEQSGCRERTGSRRGLGRGSPGDRVQSPRAGGTEGDRLMPRSRAGGTEGDNAKLTYRSDPSNFPWGGALSRPRRCWPLGARLTWLRGTH
mgnify:CR=1 FL=1